jgi:LmbE family N-acetylglucosaminyl deacetylase
VTALLLSPHNDDEALFAAFTCVRERPHVIVCLRSAVQERRGYGITAAVREAETDRAMRILGCSWEQWPYPDDVVDWPAIEARLRDLDVRYGRVYAPAPEAQEGHAHHDTLGYIADRVFGAENVTHYLTYNAQGRSTSGIPVPIEDAWVELKLMALACYRSQLGHASCVEHFLRDQHEWYAA